MNDEKPPPKIKNTPIQLEILTDFSPWDQIDSFNFYEAACLMAGVVPIGESETYPEYIENIGKQLLDIANMRQGRSESYLKAPILEIWLEDMEEYAGLSDMRPKFLEYRKKRNSFPQSNDIDGIKNELKEVKIKQKTLESENKRLVLQIKGEYLNPEHPLFSQELESAVSVWMALFANGGDVKGKGKSSKTLIRKWLKENRPDLSTAAIDRIETLSNPLTYKSGGAPKTDY